MSVRVMSMIALMALAMLVVTGCAKQGERDGPYAPAKQSWDPARTPEQLNQMRNRLATTQRDN